MKFNYRDKSPKLEQSDIPNAELKENNDIASSSTPEIKIDIPKMDFSDSPQEEKIAPPATKRPSIGSNYSPKPFVFQEPTIDLSNANMDIPIETQEEDPTDDIYETFDEFSDKNPINNIEDSIPDINPQEIDDQPFDVSETNDILDLPDDVRDIIDNPQIPEPDFSSIGYEESKQETKTNIQEKIIQEKPEITQPESSSDIQLDEVFDSTSIKKKKKSLFGKKETTETSNDEQVQQKPKKGFGFSLPFGKKKKNLQNRLDEIVQDTREEGTHTSIVDDFKAENNATSANKAIEQEDAINNNYEDNINQESILNEEETYLTEEDLLSDLNETIPEVEENINSQNSFTNLEQENNELSLEKEEISTDIPDILKDNETEPIDIAPFEDNYATSEENNNVINKTDDANEDDSPSIADFTQQKPVEENTEKQKKKSLFGSKKEKPAKEDSSADVDVLDLNPKPKKKKNKTLLIILCVLLFISIGVLFAVKTLFSNNNSVTPGIPINTAETNTDLDNDTVNSLVEETKEIVDNANSAAEQYQQNNELPPQVGVDLDAEIANENMQNSTATTKTFANNNITFVYPSEWTEISEFKARTTDPNVTNVVMLGLTPLDTDDTNNVRIVVENTLTSITAKEYLAKTEELMKQTFTNIKTRKSTELTIAGREAPSRIYTFNDESGNSVEQFQVYVANGRDIYVITFTSSEKNFAKNFDTYKEILKTIKIN